LRCWEWKIWELAGDDVRLGEEWDSSDAMSETHVLKLVLARLGGSGWLAEERSAPTAAEIWPIWAWAG
jgi:hypothetical protein